jgi:hypothetical protein
MPELRDLEVVDGLKLPDEVRAVLRPAELVRGRDGFTRRLPRWFYRVPTWNDAVNTNVTPNFKLWEFLDVDFREHELLRVEQQRFVPTAVVLLASALEVFRKEVNTYVHISANGGYRSPSHRLSRDASVHCWGVAVHLYRVGDDWLENETTIKRYGELATQVFPAFRALPFGRGEGKTEDHLHLDLGYLTVVPPGIGDEDADESAEPMRDKSAEQEESRKGGDDA